MANWPWTKEQRQYNEAKIVFSTNGAKTSGHPHAKKKKKESKPRPNTVHRKLTQNGSWT